MSKHRTPDSLRVILAPPAPVSFRHNCINCRVLQNLLDGAMAKIARLEQERLDRHVVESQRHISPTARAAAMWANQDDDGVDI